MMNEPCLGYRYTIPMLRQNDNKTDLPQIKISFTNNKDDTVVFMVLASLSNNTHTPAL